MIDGRLWGLIATNSQCEWSILTQSNLTPRRSRTMYLALLRPRKDVWRKMIMGKKCKEEVVSSIQEWSNFINCLSRFLGIPTLSPSSRLCKALNTAGFHLRNYFILKSFRGWNRMGAGSEEVHLQVDNLYVVDRIMRGWNVRERMLEKNWFTDRTVDISQDVQQATSRKSTLMS